MFSHYEKLPPIFKRIKFAKFNCGLDGNEAIASRNRIRSLPTFKLYQGGKLQAQFPAPPITPLPSRRLTHAWGHGPTVTSTPCMCHAGKVVDEMTGGRPVQLRQMLLHFNR